MKHSILKKIIDWAKGEKSIRALIMNGSLTSKGPTDELSDYDIGIFSDDIDKYSNSEEWIDLMEEVWVCEPCQINRDKKNYQTRLVIYKDGLQVDYAIFDLDYLECLKSKEDLPVEYNIGYEVLLDKDGRTKDLKAPTYEYPYFPKPTQDDFDLATKVFFFEAFKEAKALVREDLWHAKIRDWSMKKRLLKVIQWNEKAKHGFNYDTNCFAKRMKTWVTPKTWDLAHKVFARFDEEDTWACLINTIELFRELAKETTKLLNLNYLDAVDENISQYILKLREERAK